MSLLPENYIISKFYELAGFATYIKHSNIYNGCCPICREGKSWGKKKRCFYIPNNDIIYCHNCGWSSNPLKWISYITGKTNKEILEESNNDDYITEFKSNESNEKLILHDIPTLPGDCINLLDDSQVKFYKNNRPFLIALSYIYNRKLYKAINKPQTLYFCKDDKIHKNRLIIPFYDEDNNIIYYQSRGLLPKDLKEKPKYLSKIGGEKSIFGINNIKSNIENLYLFEGPIDAMFVQNGLAVGGIQDNTNKCFNSKQREQINKLSLYNQIWMLDSQYLDKASLKKTEILLQNNQNVFIWPKKLGVKFKDFNDMCIFSDRNEIPYNWINKHVFSGIQGLLKLQEIKKSL